MTTLDEAIAHAREKSDGTSDCAREHRQLEDWLVRLKHLNRVHPNMDGVNNMIGDIIDVAKKHTPAVDEDSDELWDDLLEVLDKGINPDDYPNYN